MYMDDIKRFAKNEKEFEKLIRAVRNYSQDIVMEFGIEMCHTNNEKRKTISDRRNRTNKSRNNRTLGEKETYKYL